MAHIARIETRLRAHRFGLARRGVQTRMAFLQTREGLERLVRLARFKPGAAERETRRVETVIESQRALEFADGGGQQIGLQQRLAMRQRGVGAVGAKRRRLARGIQFVVVSRQACICRC